MTKLLTTRLAGAMVDSIIKTAAKTGMCWPALRDIFQTAIDAINDALQQKPCPCSGCVAERSKPRG